MFYLSFQPFTTQLLLLELIFLHSKNMCIREPRTCVTKIKHIVIVVKFYELSAYEFKPNSRFLLPYLFHPISTSNKMSLAVPKIALRTLKIFLLVSFLYASKKPSGTTTASVSHTLFQQPFCVCEKSLLLSIRGRISPQAVLDLGFQILMNWFWLHLPISASSSNPLLRKKLPRAPAELLDLHWAPREHLSSHRTLCRR